MFFNFSSCDVNILKFKETQAEYNRDYATVTVLRDNFDMETFKGVKNSKLKNSPSQAIPPMKDTVLLKFGGNRRDILEFASKIEIYKIVSQFKIFSYQRF